MTSEITPAASLALIEPLPLTNNPAAAYIASLTSPESRRTMISDLNALSDLLSSRTGDKDATRYLNTPWHKLTAIHADALRAELLTSGRSPATVNRMLCALRGVIRKARRLRLIDADDAADILEVQAVKFAKSAEFGRMIAPSEKTALLTACRQDTTAAGRRDAALIAVLDGAGLRRAEVAALDLADYVTDKQGRGSIRVRNGKGRKQRSVKLAAGAARYIEEWIAERGTDPGALFQPVNKGGTITPRHMTTTAIYDALLKRQRQAGIGDLIRPHDFRRTFASEYFDAGTDVSIIQKEMGHADPGTTAGYDRRPAEAAYREATKRHVPYV